MHWIWLSLYSICLTIDFQCRLHELIKIRVRHTMHSFHIIITHHTHTLYSHTGDADTNQTAFTCLSIQWATAAVTIQWNHIDCWHTINPYRPSLSALCDCRRDTADTISTWKAERERITLASLCNSTTLGIFINSYINSQWRCGVLSNILGSKVNLYDWRDLGVFCLFVCLLFPHRNKSWMSFAHLYSCSWHTFPSNMSTYLYKTMHRLKFYVTFLR